MTDEPGAGFYAAYEEHSRTLRTWLVTYGAGVPLLLLSNERIWGKLANSDRTPVILKMFLGGIALQAGLAALNKLLMWALYYGDQFPAYKNRKRYQVCDWLSERIWIDFAVDAATVLLFVIATQQLSRIVLT